MVGTGSIGSLCSQTAEGDWNLEILVFLVLK